MRPKSTAVSITLLAGVLLASLASTGYAQDVPGIENCMAEKQIERRTSCLQSNINFLKTTITTEIGKARADAQTRLDESTRQIAALQLTIAGLQEEIRKLRSEAEAARQKTEPAKPAK